MERDRFLIKKLTVSHLVKIPRLLWNADIHHSVQQSPLPFPIVSQMYAVSKVRFTNALPSTSWSLLLMYSL